MSTEKEDTDPSSPGALRSPGRNPTTDPGLGPRSQPQLPSRRPVSVVVPAPSSRRDGPNAITPPETPISAFANKDSVELLLEGMAGPRPDRRKAKPQSDGEASAAYHAEHGVRRARTPSEPSPKVVVDRAPALGAVLRERPPTARAKPGSSREALSTFVPARVLRRRVALAVVAGTLLVLVLFVGLKLSSGRHSSASAAPSQPTATGADGTPTRAPAATAIPAAAAPAVPPASTGARSDVPAAEGERNAAAAAKTPSTPGVTGKGRHKAQGNGSPSANGAGGGDTGEFSTTF